MDDYCDIKEKIGSGSWGDIYKLGGYNEKCVIKKLKSDNIKQFETTTEVDILFRIKCPYILKGIKLLCLSNEKKENGYIIDSADGDFYKLLEEEEIKKYDQLCIQIALGIKCLHLNNYLHLDISMGNCMYNKINDDEYRGILIDFGLSAAVQRDNNNNIIPFKSKQTRITVTYRPPECFEGVLDKNEDFYLITYTEKCDVWSLGLVFIELFNGNTPFNLSLDAAPKEYIDKLKKSTVENSEKINLELYDVCVKNQIPKLFNNSVKKDVLNKLVKNGPKKHLWVDLLYKMLEINPSKRINIEDVINHKVFSEYINIYPYSCDIITSANIFAITMSEDRKKVLENILILLYKISNMHIEVYFTALDLTLRVFSSFDDTVTAYWLNAYMLTCVSLSLRIYEFENKIPINLQQYSDINIYDREIKVLKIVNGIIRQPLIYDYCDTLTEMSLVHTYIFSSIENLKKYTSMNLKQYCLDLKSNSDLTGSKNCNIGDFIKFLNKPLDKIFIDNINYGKWLISLDLLKNTNIYLKYDIKVLGLALELYQSYCKLYPEVYNVKLYCKFLSQACIFVSFKNYYNNDLDFYKIDDRTMKYVNILKKEIKFTEKIFNLCITIEDWRTFYNTYIMSKSPLHILWEEIELLPNKKGEREKLTLGDFIK